MSPAPTVRGRAKVSKHLPPFAQLFNALTYSRWSKEGNADAALCAGTMFLSRKMKLGDVERYVRTWSAVSKWQEAWPERKSRAEGGEGDVVDEMFEGIVDAEEGWLGEAEAGWREVEVEVEWGSGLVLARRR